MKGKHALNELFEYLLSDIDLVFCFLICHAEFEQGSSAAFRCLSIRNSNHTLAFLFLCLTDKFNWFEILFRCIDAINNRKAIQNKTNLLNYLKHRLLANT